MGFRDPQQASNAIEALKVEMARVVLPGASSTRNAEGAQGRRKKKETSSFWDRHDRDVERSNASAVAGPTDDISVEVAKYLRMKSTPRNQCPLIWWREIGREVCPRIYQVALKYLIIPGSSVPCER